MEAQYKYTSLGRPLDPRLSTNLAIMVFTLVGGIIAGIITLLAGEGLVRAALAGFYSGAAVFAAWAISREIDPDYDYSAFVGSALAMVASLAVIPPDIIVLGSVLVLTRIVNRIVGLPPKVLDAVAGLIVTTLAVFTGRWWFGFVGIMVFLLDAWLPEGQPRQYIAAFAAAGVTGVYLLMHGAGSPGEITLPYVVGVLVISAAFIGVMVSTRQFSALTDITREPLITSRIKAAMGIVLLTGWLAMWEGDAGIMSLAPLWATLLGVVLYRLFVVVRGV